MFVCEGVTGCLSDGFHQHRLADAELHPQVRGTQLVQTQVHAAQQVIWKRNTRARFTDTAHNTDSHTNGEKKGL